MEIKNKTAWVEKEMNVWSSIMFPIGQHKYVWQKDTLIHILHNPKGKDQVLLAGLLTWYYNWSQEYLFDVFDCGATVNLGYKNYATRSWFVLFYICNCSNLLPGNAPTSQLGQLQKSNHWIAGILNINHGKRQPMSLCQQYQNHTVNILSWFDHL